MEVIEGQETVLVTTTDIEEKVEEEVSKDDLETFGDDAGEEEVVCLICGGEAKHPQLAACLHSTCRNCAVETGGREGSVFCNSCNVSTSLSALVPDFVHDRNAISPSPNVNSAPSSPRLASLQSLLHRARTRGGSKEPGEQCLSQLQEQREITEAKIESTYQSCLATLELAKKSALCQLEERYRIKQEKVIENLEKVTVADNGVEAALQYGEILVATCSQEQVALLQPLVQDRLLNMLNLEQGADTSKEALSMDWHTDKEALSRAVLEKFGKLSTPTTSPSSSSSPGCDMLGSLLRATPQPLPLGQITPTPGLLSVGPMSPRHITRSPHPGPVGSSVSSPSHQFISRPHLSHPDLSSPVPSPRQLRGLSPVEYNLAALASITGCMERSKSGPLSGSSNSVGGGGPGFTLADLISNVGEEGEGDVRWGDGEGTDTGNHQALSNLTALAKLEEMERSSNSRSSWPPPDPNLLLPLDRDCLTRSLSNLGSDAVSPSQQSLISPSLLSPSVASPGHNSISPLPMGLTVPGLLGPRGNSPISPLDNLMPGLGLVSQSVSPVPGSLHTQPILRSGINMAGLLTQPGSAQPRSLNSMQIRCKFGQLGPGKGQFNSPHGFCLGLEEEIIVADTNNHRIQVFEKNGTFRYQFGIPGKEEGQLWYPRKVAVMKSSGKFVVCDRGNERSRMQIFTKHGHFVRKIAIRYIDIVAGLAITRDGNIVAVDSVTPTLFVISEGGELLRWFDCADYMREPSDIAVGGREFYVCDFKGHNVVVFTEDGVFVRRIGCESITNFPNGIDISDAGDILIGDSHGNRFHVAVFANDGNLLAEFECPHVKVSRCCGLKITSEGYVVTLAKNNHHVLVLNTLYIA